MEQSPTSMVSLHFTNISPTNKTIIVSFIGMETQEVTIKPEMKIVMTSTTEVMEEVLVVAYGTAKKSAFTGSAKMIHTEQITKRPVTNVIEVYLDKWQAYK